MSVYLVAAIFAGIGATSPEFRKTPLASALDYLPQATRAVYALTPFTPFTDLSLGRER